MLAQLEAYHAQYGLDYAFCVSTNLYGPNDKFDEKWGHVIPSLVSKFHDAATQGKDVTVWGTGKARRDFLFAEDAAAAMRQIADRFTGPINLASGETHSIRDLVNTLSEVTGFQGRLIWDETKPDGQNLRQYDISKLQGLGFKPANSLRQGLEKTYAWFKANAGQVRR
jgi:GDP-L-fucose synthase